LLNGDIMVDCWQSVVHLPRVHSLFDWYDTVDDENDVDVDESRDAFKTSYDSPANVARERILMEIVGAMGLESKQRRTVDPYCTVHTFDKKRQWTMIHRTQTIRNDGNPIWTVKSKSLCLLEVPVGRTERLEALSNSTVSDTEPSSEESDEDITKNVMIDVCHASTRLGSVCVPNKEIIRLCSSFGNERTEFRIKASQEHSILGSAVLALRFRVATEHDLIFLHKLAKRESDVRELTKASINPNPDHVNKASSALLAQQPQDGRKVAADINFQSVKLKSIFQRQQKTGSEGQELFRIIPYPDPDRPDEETEWMSAAGIEHTAYQPSTKWVTAGCGSLGTIYLEVIGCNNLPQMDVDLSLTDAFVTMAFEDNFLRTDVIWDHLSPRWMPWTTRAFQFDIRHPASMLFLSVFDFDEMPLDKHDPIGRVVLHPSSFRPGMTHTLHYPLQDHPSAQYLPDSHMSADSVSDLSSKPAKFARGTITVRLRMQWKDEGDAMKRYFSSPPRFTINVDNDKSYDVLCYTTRGAIYMDEPSLTSVKGLAHEIMSYWENLCFTFDVMTEILLWRGRWVLTENMCIWFPIHSVALFVGAVIIIERPHLIIPVLLYAAAYFLLCMHYNASHHPNPWLRFSSNREISTSMTIGRRSLVEWSGGGSGGPREIAPDQNVGECVQQGKLDAVKAARMSVLIQAALVFVLKVYRIYGKTGDYAITITTERRNCNFLSDRLYYVHKLLLVICHNMRLGRNFICWKSNCTAIFTVYCVTLATAWLIFPVSVILRWLLRLLVWTILGPWMKIVDIKYFRPWYLTRDELLERIRNRTVYEERDLPDFDRVFESETFGKMIRAGRVKAEELHKLRDMRTLLFGSYSEAIPCTDNSRYPSVPLPQSTAVRSELPPPRGAAPRGYHVPGQLLTGNMILSRPLPVIEHHAGSRETGDESVYDPSSEEKKTN
jgi:hypothetical protein